ncbi:MAG TPA: hypothetical protein VG271_10800 [Beijerinckiaceae bacterium]|nr:hypothetical protein [Beijerinckiaceae bacterium]
MFSTEDFETLPKSGRCEYCGSGERSNAYKDYFDAVYCLSLREQPHRTAAMAELLHRLGLCNDSTLLLPSRAKHQPRAIWTSHRDIARHALDRGLRRILIFEDDAFIRIDEIQLRARLHEAMAQLPEDWWGLFIGHAPLQAYPIGLRLLRARSAASHAYVASERLLNWLAETEPMDPEVRVCRTIGASIDAALANLPGMYALFPMVATQRFMNNYRMDPLRDTEGHRRALTDKARYRTFLICHMMRVTEALALLFAPWHWLTLEYFRRRSGRALQREARAIRASKGFDEDYYLTAYPDVAASGRLPLEHYLVDGKREGRKPRAEIASS